MNLTSHPVAPEEIMAYVDGELSSSEATAVAAHMETCDECAELAEGFRNTSQWLSRWTVPAMPAPLEEAIRNRMAGASASSARKFPQVRRGRWKWWMAGGGAALAATALILISFSFTQHAYFHSGGQAQSTHAEPVGMQGQGDRYSGNLEAYIGGGGGQPSSHRRMLMSDSRSAAAKMPPESLNFLSTTDASVSADDSDSAPMIARTISVTILVKDIAAARPALDSIVGRHRGYAAELNVRSPEGGPRGFDSSLRIPAPELTSALGELRGLGRVERETQSSEEVSQQHADLLARLHTSRETEERFRAILQQRTGSVADVLEVEEGIARVRGEIEGMEAEQRTLEHRVDYAKVDIEMTEEYKASLAASGDSLATRLHNAVVSGYEHASGTVVGIVLFFAEYGPAILIWVVLLALPVFLIRRRYRRLHQRTNT